MARIHALRIVADDLSGAAECAAVFAGAAGKEVAVYLNEAPVASEQCALDTNSRAMDADAASRAAFRAIEWARAGQRSALVFKKIDSTLRGHIGTELAAALNADPRLTGVVVAPSFPEQHRELRRGKLYVDGHAFPPEDPADLVAILEKAGLRTVVVDSRGANGSSLRLQIANALQGGARAVAVDARCAEDLAQIALAVDLLAPFRILVAGSNGLARALAGAMTPERSPSACVEHRTSSPRPGPVIAVVGSFSSKSIAQVRSLAVHGCADVVECDPSGWLEARAQGLGAEKLRHAEALLGAGRSVAFAIGGELPVAHASGKLIQAVAAAVAPLLQRASALVLTGGDTARAVLECLRVQRLDVYGEFEPGISMGRIASTPGMRIFIKAGAFGDDFTLRRVFEHLDADRTDPTNQRRLA